ncbi:hypothetical protein OGAPHI_005951 [Ogataea philodendri]|uniref:Uncharacterized protein n=1 Tax=Ogataea philodendri TaxID=1378263 RepID=A0A9P8T0H4_9ASCO|nr:uncharacterized protein OGAPHI_005951 [Ogataea philodendri]KAH3661773.1 hypothetical protein OGAPHI_005951 [Ogataea philodendri]
MTKSFGFDSSVVNSDSVSNTWGMMREHNGRATNGFLCNAKIKLLRPSCFNSSEEPNIKSSVDVSSRYLESSTKSASKAGSTNVYLTVVPSKSLCVCVGPEDRMVQISSKNKFRTARKETISAAVSIASAFSICEFTKRSNW